MVDEIASVAPVSLLVDDVARAIHDAGEDEGGSGTWQKRSARAALQTVARYLREPSEEMKELLGPKLDCYYQEDLPEFLHALASHLEKEMG